MLPLLPESLSGWLSLIVQFVVAVTATMAVALRMIRGPLQAQASADRTENERRFKDHGERLGAVNQTAATNAARIETTDRAVERMHLTQTSLAEAFGRQDARMDRVLDMQEKHERERLTEDRNIGERLARIETRLDVHEDLKKLFTQVLGKASER